MALRARAFQSEILRNVKTPAVFLTSPGKVNPEHVRASENDWA